MSEEKTFETSIKELEKIVQELENGDIDLDKSMEKYKEAMYLIDSCEKKLKNASDVITKIVDNDGKISDFKIGE